MKPGGERTATSKLCLGVRALVIQKQMKDHTAVLKSATYLSEYIPSKHAMKMITNKYS